MEQQPHPLPAARQQPLSVDFIQNTLSRKLDIVRDAPVYYNSQSKRFEPIKTAAAAIPPPSTGEKARPEQQDASNGREMTTKTKIRPPVREPVPAVEAMVFWNAILEPAMTQFITRNQPEPEKLVEKPQYSIRAKNKWQDIHETLQSVKDIFDGTGKPVLSRVKHIYRKVADHTENLQETVLKLPDDGGYVSLVKSVLSLLLGPVIAAAQTRMKITGFADEEDMKKGFSKVEIFLAAFPGDQNIREASVDLIACVLKAVEKAILYFLSHTVSRATGRMKQELIDSVDEIPAQTKELMERVEESHIWGMQKALGLTLANIEELRLLSVENTMAISLKTDQIFNQGQEVILRLDSVGYIVQDSIQQFIQQQEIHDANFRTEQEKRDHRIKAEIQADVMNGVKIVLDDCWDEYAKNLDEKIAKAVQQGIESINRSYHSAATSRNPSPRPEEQHSPYQRPLQNPYDPSSWSRTPDGAYQQQFYPPNLSYLQPQPSAYTSAQYYQQPLPLPAPHVTEPTIIPVSALLSILGNLAGLDKRDIQSALSQSESIPIHYRLRAQEIVQAREFRAWATVPSPRNLLILGDPSLDPVEAGVAVSLVTASLMTSLRTRGAGFASLVFFCGLHKRRDDPHAGAAAMIKALIAQLLEQHYVGYQFRENELGLSLEQLAGSDTTTAADLATLCGLFEWLVKWLPRDKTLVVVLDGIEEYEMAQFKEGMLVVLRCLLGLVAAAEGGRQGPVVKVLATCPTGTICLRNEFRSKGPESVLLMEALQVVSERMDMELGDQQFS